MHTGETYEIPVKDYDMAELNEQRNNNELNGILIGDYSLSRINIRDIVPLEEPVQEDTPIEEEEPQEETPTETL